MPALIRILYPCGILLEQFQGDTPGDALFRISHYGTVIAECQHGAEAERWRGKIVKIKIYK